MPLEYPSPRLLKKQTLGSMWSSAGVWCLLLTVAAHWEQAWGDAATLKTAEQMDKEAADFEQGSPVTRALQCSSQYPEYDAVIATHLEAWRSQGISLQLILSTIQNHTTRTAAGRRSMGFAGGFRSGKAVLLDIPRLDRTYHFPAVIFSHMRMLIDLEKTFAHTLPDLDLVIAVTDMPNVARSNAPGSDPPLFRYCKTEINPDILIPNFHAYTLHQPSANRHARMEPLYHSLVRSCRQHNEDYPWETKLSKALNRGTFYERRNMCAAPTAVRLGPGRSDICTPCSAAGVVSCEVRASFSEWAGQSHPDVLDVSTKANPKHTDMEDQPKYKYLVHLDGIGLSSRMEQLLPLGGLVFREESGYSGYLYPLMKPNIHYVPFWKEVPEELLDGLRWARDNDAQAQRIALQGQVFAQTYITRKARACYWFKLLRAYAQLLRYKPADQLPATYRAPSPTQTPQEEGHELQAYGQITDTAMAEKAIGGDSELTLLSHYDDVVIKKHEKAPHWFFWP